MEEDEGRVVRKVLSFRDLDRIIVGSYPCFSGILPLSWVAFD